MARVRVFRQTFGESVREIVVRRALNETYGTGGDIVLDVDEGAVRWQCDNCFMTTGQI